MASRIIRFIEAGSDPARAALRGFPPASSCSFCGTSEDVEVRRDVRRDVHQFYTWAQCCGAQGPLAASALEAAQKWNARRSARAISSRALGSVPSRDILDRRLEAQRLRCLHAESICRLATLATSALEDGLHEVTTDQIVAIRATFEGLAEQLDSVKDAISPEDMLAPETAEEKEAAAEVQL